MVQAASDLRRSSSLYPAAIALQTEHVSDEILFLSLREVQVQDEIEKLHDVVQSRTTPVVEVRRCIFNSPQGEGLDRTFRSANEKSLQL